MILNMTVPFNTDEFLFLDPSLESAFYIVAAFNSKPCPVVELERKILGHFLLWFPNFENAGLLCNSKLWIPI